MAWPYATLRVRVPLSGQPATPTPAVPAAGFVLLRGFLFPLPQEPLEIRFSHSIAGPQAAEHHAFQLACSQPAPHRLVADSQPLGHLNQQLKPGQFAQIDDVFAKVKAARVANGSAVVQTSSMGGAFLAYASVIRGHAAPVTYVFPDKERPANAPAHN